ncbi:FAD-dependent oxidoreductase [Opitutus sp. ER46]|uniref:dihydrolipoyl dehydrogenase family protein n=1 Tax=Opitutus sp. ER46 TaxID=2161864 RepID=UPI000D3164C3|nr:FAD-dependent oxidoreductase [Opitutus sp. ER46]PTX94332.1 mercuric reductase [Opitutus sp. ER46]
MDAIESVPTTPETYDLLVLGSGEAGKYLAWTMARKGLKTAVVERRYIGGSCPNIACLPTKNLIHSAKIASLFTRRHEFGLSTDHAKINMPAVRERIRRMVLELVELHRANFEASGTELIMGTGRFVGERTLAVALSGGGERRLQASNVVISTGSRATIAAIPGLPEAQPLTHIEALELDVVPPHLVILGGGYAGLEFAQAMRRLGSKVTVVERNDRLAHREDGDVSDAFHALFRDDGIEVLTGATVVRVEGISGRGVTLHIVRADAEMRVTGSHLLVAAGRTPNTSDLGLARAGVEITPHGFVKVNERLETTASGVWAVGDCAGSPHFTHVAFDDFRVVRDNLSGGARVTTARLVPSCVFTDPQFARIGLNETEAHARGIAYRVAKLPMAAVLRTRTLSASRGFLKALLEPVTDRILGFAAFGVDAGEMLAAVQVAMMADLPFTRLRDSIFAHPTLSEGLVMLFAAVPAATEPAPRKDGTASSAAR